MDPNARLSSIDHESGEEPSLKRRRASRAGQAKRFECRHPGCNKRYSRAEHLHRHELNHNPKEIYHCEFPNCGHSFVRFDLYARHKARHDEPVPGSPTATGSTVPEVDMSNPPIPPDVTAPQFTTINARQQPHPDPASAHWTPAVTQPLPTSSSSIPREESTTSNMFPTMAQSAVASPELVFNANEQWNSTAAASGQANDNFAAWLFESPGSQDNEFNIANLPFLDFGLQYSPKDDIWNIDELSSNEHNGPFDQLSAPTATGTESRDDTQSSKLICEYRRAEIISLIAHFAVKQRISTKCHDNPQRLLYSLDGQHFPNLTITVLDNLVANYWLSSHQMPIVHEPTFSSSSCHVLLLLAMIALGATDLVRTKAKGNLAEYTELAHLIMIQLRWEIFTDADAQPPIQLWVAQALLLLEYYEKQCSTRKLHERAHIHHGTTLTLLRRGNPLVGRSESETPSELPSRPASSGPGGEVGKRSEASLHSWWLQWARNESFNRVVFTAFQMDTLHAVMYGHAADMAPYEIRLPLPCDDSLWNATNSMEVQRLDANLKMYGIRPINFLDGLKKCIHAHDVQTHAPARMLLMSGLLSVGWHISRREKHLQFLETIPSVREQGRWRLLLLRAFGHWRDSFDEAVGSRSGNIGSKMPDYNSARAAVLFHLAHMTLHIDIIDCQIFAGTKQLLGRQVSQKDYHNVLQRMKTWALRPESRHAALHAYKLLHVSLVKQPGAKKGNDPTERNTGTTKTTTVSYTCRTDPITFRPWALFIAGLIVWSYQHASSLYLTASPAQQIHLASKEEQAVCCRYLAVCAAIEDSAQLAPVLSTQGCAAVLGVLSQSFFDADPELLHEASKTLRDCRDALGTSNFIWPSS